MSTQPINPEPGTLLRGVQAKLTDVKDGSDWRSHVCSKGQLTTELPRFLIASLIQAKALTFLVAPSYNLQL